MFPSKRNSIRLAACSNNREGISIIEVLTAIVVAMIGVFGVMVLIPFAIKQAQTGLDLDAATAVARNAIAQMEISGYRNTANWSTFETVGGVTAASPAAPQIFSIDPLAVTENRDTVSGLGEYGTTTFPYHRFDAGPTAYPALYDITPASLITPTGFAMTVANARRMCRGGDDLEFGEAIETAVGLADEKFNGPMQRFDTDGAGANLRRQYRGELSWSAVVVPVKDDYINNGSVTQASKYRMYILVYKNRVPNLLNFDNQMATAAVQHPSAPGDLGNIGVASPLSTVFLEAGVTVEGAIRKGDWVMLINRTLNNTDDGIDPSHAEKGYDRQLAFCRVVNYTNADTSLATSRATLTLDGPDFNFGDPNGRDGTPSVIQQAHVVHLKDVVAVYERTFVPEGASIWNVSN
jgi:Tfp pilus assembly protein PilV